jgi:hypothetical protein
MATKQATALESCTLFCGKSNWNTVVGVIATQLPDFAFKISSDSESKTLETSARNTWFNEKRTLRLVWNPFQEAEDERKNQLIDFIQEIPARNASLVHECALFGHHVKGALTVEVSPHLDEEFGQVIKALAKELNALIFTEDPGRFFQKSSHPHFLDASFNLILDSTGNSGISSLTYELPKSGDLDQQERRERSISKLSGLGISLSNEGPLIASSSEIQLRTPHELVQRAYALLAVAIRGEGITGEPMEQFIEEKQINGFSPEEKDLMQSENPGDTELELARNRYECLYTLLWAMGLTDSLPSPDVASPIDEIMEIISAPERDEFQQRVRMRPEWEILDTTDQYLRYYLACDDARNHGNNDPNGLNVNLVFERLQALSWLIKHQNKPWDEVSVDFD